MDEHVNDIYVKKAQVDGYRSRASYKLIEINEKDNLFRAGSVVMDLGSAPGGWSQIVAPIVGDSGRVIASDILPMSGIVGVDFIQGDFTDEAVYDQILQTLGDDQVDTVVSDMAPNMSGVNTTDQYASMYLVELALDMARNVLKPGGRFFCLEFSKIQNSNFDFIYKKYSELLPAIGQFIVGEKQPYEYLVKSIENFVNQEELIDLMKKEGFEKCFYRNLSGGIVSIHSGWKI